jgi:hypothetical protein
LSFCGIKFKEEEIQPDNDQKSIAYSDLNSDADSKSITSVVNLV